MRGERLRSRLLEQHMTKYSRTNTNSLREEVKRRALPSVSQVCLRRACDGKGKRYFS